jgi:hypothetical protein
MTDQFERVKVGQRTAKMPWGKYRGWFLKDVPADYLKWCVKNYTDDSVAKWVADELMCRRQFVNEMKRK